MSYNYNQGHYGQQQPPPPPPRPQQAYYDPNNPHAQQQGAQNGYQQQQYPTQYAYGGQASHDAYPTSPRQPAYPGQQQYQYNPADYASPVLQAPVQQYNPQNYASSPQYASGQYSAGGYGQAEAQTSATSGPVDPYGYSAGYAASPYSPRQSSLPQSPGYGQQTFQQHYSPQSSTSQYTYPGHSPHQQQQQYGGYRPPPAPSTHSPQQSYGRYQPPPATTAQSQDFPYRTTSYASRQHATSLNDQQYGVSSSIPPPADEWRPSPPAHHASDHRQSPSPLYGAGAASMPSPPSNSDGPTPPVHRSDTLNRHPHSRPLPGRPGADDSGYFGGRRSDGRQMSREEAEAQTQEDLFQQVENAVYNAGRSGSAAHSPSISVSQPPYPDGDSTPLFAPPSPNSNARRNGSVINGHLSPAPRDQPYSSDSDAEAAQGLAMMRMAEEDDARRQSSGSQMRHSGGYGSQRNSQTHRHAQREASDSDDYGAVDMSTFGGGYEVPMTYADNPNQYTAGGAYRPDLNGHDSYSQSVSQQSSMRRSHASRSSHQSREYNYHMDSIHPFPPFNSNARVDAGGTGGLSEPTADGRRQSYDEGDEYTLMDGNLPDRFPDEPPDIFYHQASTSFNQAGSVSYRPLPATPGSEYSPSLQTDYGPYKPPTQLQGQYPAGPEGYTVNQQGQWVPRSTSLISHTTQPQVQQPLRSKTDAEERQRKQGYRSSYVSEYTTPAATTPAVDLPSIGGKRFVPSQLGAPAFKKCDEPWSLMSILKWLMQVTNPEQVTELRESEVKESLVALFTNKVPTMNIADAEGLSNRVVKDMYDASTLVKTEEWVKIVPGPMNGVIFQLTGTGCYAPTIHDHHMEARCYSHHCQRTLKKVNLSAQSTRTAESWVEFYNLKKEDTESRDKKEIEVQNVLHEIVTGEESYMEQLNVLRTMYRDPLSAAEPSIISPKRRDKFLRDVFGRVDAVKQANEEHLLPQLKYRQHEQGPWIIGFSDIFRQWVRKAKAAYIDYAGSFPGATFMVRQELDRNIDFRNFVDKVRSDKRSLRLDWNSYLQSPIKRLQRYTLLLKTALKNMRVESEEKRNLQVAIDEVSAVTLECDARVAEMQRKVDLSDLQMKLLLRPQMQKSVSLNLDHFGRELIHRGDLQRMGGNRFTWLDSHALLFDHYLVLAKTVGGRTEQGGKQEKYDVSRLPIPMDLLILESVNDPAVQKRDYVKGITSVRDVTGRTTSSPDPTALGRAPTNQAPGPNGLQHVNTGASSTSLQTVTSLNEGKDQDKIMYPFKVKHLGRETYTLFAPNEQARRDWCTKITEAKTKHAAALYNQNAEPFHLRVMADSAFVYDAFGLSGAGRAPVIKGTPVDRAVKEVELRFKDTGRPGPICRARVNCATSFSTQYGGKQMVAVGTDFGVYVSEADNPRGWTKAIPMSRVTQVAVLEEFNLFLLISDKSLIAYHLDVICPGTSNGPSSTSNNNDSIRKAPQKLSGSKDVGFFVTGRMKERTLVFYKKRENLASVFKVLEPIYQKSTEKKRGMFKRGTTEFFREYDEFYIPTECSDINLFHSSLAVGTARGFEVLTLDKKQPWSVPELKAPHVQNIATHIKDQKALSMLRLSDQEFLLVYAQCAVYVNKHGDVSRSVIMEFVGTANSAALYAAYLILFDNDFVEIRNAQNGRLKQIIAGREVKMLDDGGSWSSAPVAGSGISGPVINGRTVKLVMQHPEAEKTQVVVELLLNEKMKEQGEA